MCSSKFQEEDVEENERQDCGQKLRDSTVGLQSGCWVRESLEGAEEKAAMDQRAPEPHREYSGLELKLCVSQAAGRWEKAEERATWV